MPHRKSQPPKLKDLIVRPLKKSAERAGWRTQELTVEFMLREHQAGGPLLLAWSHRRIILLSSLRELLETDRSEMLRERGGEVHRTSSPGCCSRAGTMDGSSPALGTAFCILASREEAGVRKKDRSAVEGLVRFLERSSPVFRPACAPPLRVRRTLQRLIIGISDFGTASGQFLSLGDEISLHRNSVRCAISSYRRVGARFDCKGSGIPTSFGQCPSEVAPTN